MFAWPNWPRVKILLCVNKYFSRKELILLFVLMAFSHVTIQYVLCHQSNCFTYLDMFWYLVHPGRYASTCYIQGLLDLLLTWANRYISMKQFDRTHFFTENIETKQVMRVFCYQVGCQTYFKHSWCQHDLRFCSFLLCFLFLLHPFSLKPKIGGRTTIHPRKCIIETHTWRWVEDDFPLLFLFTWVIFRFQPLVFRGAGPGPSELF